MKKELGLNVFGVQELGREDLKSVEGGDDKNWLAVATGYWLSELLFAYADANPGYRECPI